MLSNIVALGGTPRSVSLLLANLPITKLKDGVSVP
jgi:hypothetical protein